MSRHQHPDSPPADGLAMGVGAYALWGLLPLYFKLLQPVGAVEIVAHRVAWSLLLVLAIVALRRRLALWRSLLRQVRVLRLMAASATLIAVNWLVYVWAVNHAHVVAASLGYFLNPLVNVVLGLLVFGERLGRLQWTAIALAGAGVAVMAQAAPGGLWISLALALSFGFYGMVRKLAPIESLEGLATETLLLTPAALVYLVWLGVAGGLDFGQERGTDLLLMLSSVMTSVPLLLFAAAARRLRYSTLGLLQYIAPTLQFLLGVLAFGEPLTTRMLIAFALIWTGLAVFTAHALATHRRRRPAPAV
ncbi:EamA family transporter RarD [Stakelama saccharophila]|uniref:EamA family transporter RarD n=1 Tax=Stakelama saccharophila TaxID=3075605 RepID=A0ABZ0BBN2_9SPHN|nr:EamA family transporter RarD [Stakelama sp. W311]WNO54693.1 EamA family transporter RarD [Stakelama sp. W311]